MSYKNNIYSIDEDDIKKFGKITRLQDKSMVSVIRTMIKMYIKQYSHLLPQQKDTE